MNNMVPFGQGQAPAFLTQLNMSPEQIAAMNAAAAVGTGTGGGVNRISLKAGRFRLIVGGTETMVIPTLNIQVVVIRANDGVTKTWYEKEWSSEQSDNQAPDCSSDDGITPRMDSPKRQADKCATCPQNEWGSKINKQSGAKVKACADAKTMAVVPPGSDQRFAGNADMYQLKVPAASLGEFGGMVKSLSTLPTPVPYNAVVTEVAFDTNASYPRILFKPVRYLDAEEYAAVTKRWDEDETKRVAGLAEAATMRVPAAPALAAPVQQAPVQQAPVQQPQQQWAQPVQQAPVQQAPVQQQAPTQQWVQQPQQQAPVQQEQAAQGWGPAPTQQAPVQQQAPIDQQWAQPAQQAPIDQQWAQPAQQAPVQQPPTEPLQRDPNARYHASGREVGRPMAGGARRTKAEMQEDAAFEAAQGGGQPQQQAPAQQAPVQQQWGEPTQQAPVQQPAPQQWAQQAPVQQAPVQQAPAFDSSNPFGGAGQQPAQGAPIQPNVIDASAGGVPEFFGWDD